MNNLLGANVANVRRDRFAAEFAYATAMGDATGDKFSNCALPLSNRQDAMLCTRQQETFLVPASEATRKSRKTVPSPSFQERFAPAEAFYLKLLRAKGMP
jgi:hypothetical protein